ncbi:MAG: flavin reductase family protein [Elusimicrobiota bacterium]
MELEPDDLSTGDRYKLMTSVIQPRPIAWVSTQDKYGCNNLAPFSFFTGITAKPMTLCFAPALDGEGRKKDTLVNIEATGAFVVNAATEATAGKMVQTSAAYPYGVDEFKKAGLTPERSLLVDPPRVKESPVSLECKLDRVLEISKGPMGGNLVIGTVVYVRIHDALWKQGRVSHRDLKAVGRLEGRWYSRVTDDLEIPWPKI